MASSITNLLNPSSPAPSTPAIDATMEQDQQQYGINRCREMYSNVSRPVSSAAFAPELFSVANDDEPMPDIDPALGIDPRLDDTLVHGVAGTEDLVSPSEAAAADEKKPEKPKGKSTKQNPEKLKDTKHSSKNEGQSFLFNLWLNSKFGASS